MQIYKNYSINVLVRVVAILVLCFATAYFGLLSPYWTVGLWMLLFITLLSISLINYTQRTKREMVNFLLAIKQNDFTSTTQSSELGYDLRFAQREILKVFQYLNKEKEFEHQYLKTIVEHVQVALVCFGMDGEIVLFNNAASEFFQRNFIKNIDELKTLDAELLNKIEHIKTGQKELVKFISDGSLSHISLQCSTFKLQHKEFKLVSFQDLKAEMEENELASWQKLIKVMTHEIKNSAIPIATLTDVIYQQFREKTASINQPLSLEEEQLEDLKTSLLTVSNRSKGLVNFVKAYNSLTKLPPPKIEAIKVAEILTGISKLLQSKLLQTEIGFTVNQSQPDLIIKCDRKLIEQLLINLLINAMDAVKSKNQPIIQLNTFINNVGRTCIQITDNGGGIAPEMIDDVFIPFYTTKPDGSGIGLSLSRQIMRMHKGRIEILTSSEKGTTILVTF